jgi:hypothetical protein
MLPPSGLGASARLPMRYTTAPLKENSDIVSNFSVLSRRTLLIGSETLSMNSPIEAGKIQPMNRIPLLVLAGAPMDGPCGYPPSRYCKSILTFAGTLRHWKVSTSFISTFMTEKLSLASLAVDFHSCC